MKIVDNKVFIDSFRELERAIRDNFPKMESTSPVMFYEERLSKTDVDKAGYLTHLRQKRNLITHNSAYTDKAVCSDFDVEFINGIIYEVNATNGLVKDFYKPFKSLPVVSESDTLKTLLEVCQAKKKLDGFHHVYVVNDDKTSIGTISFESILSEIAKGKRMTAKVKTLDGIVPITETVDSTAPMPSTEDVKKPVPVVSRKKLVGVLY